MAWDKSSLPTQNFLSSPRVTQTSLSAGENRIKKTDKMMKLLGVVAFVVAVSMAVPRRKAEPLKVMSFNIQIFGQKKASKSEVMERLTKVPSPRQFCPLAILYAGQLRSSIPSIWCW